MKGWKDNALEEGWSVIDVQTQHSHTTQYNINICIDTYEYDRPQKEWGVRKYNFIGD